MIPEPTEALIEDALFAVNPRVSKATADYARAACRNLAAALTREPEAGKLREALERVRQRLMNAAESQIEKGGDYLYVGRAEAWITHSINDIDTALRAQGQQP